MSLEESLQSLKSSETRILDVGRQLMEVNEGVYPFDFFCAAQLNRALNLSAGYVQLAEADNFICAFAIVRIHLDTLLRLYAIQLIDKNIDEIAIEIHKGRAINTYKNKFKNCKLTDSHLAQELSEVEGFDWVKDLYLAGNSFVHFSDKHLRSTNSIKRGSQKLLTVISKNGSFIPVKEKQGATERMLNITEGILIIIINWIKQKRSYKE